VQVLQDLYEPEAFFGGWTIFTETKAPFFAAMRDYHRRNPGGARAISSKTWPGGRPFRALDEPRSRSTPAT